MSHLLNLMDMVLHFSSLEFTKKLLAEFGEILDITDPDGKSQSERNEVSHEKEQQEFNADHYLSDLFDSVEEINSIISEPCEFSAGIIGFDNNTSAEFNAEHYLSDLFDSVEEINTVK